LLERDRELGLIEGALQGSERGRGLFVILYGPAGIGRSSVLRASVLKAQERGTATMEACGSELERGYGFGVVRQLLEATIASLNPAQRRSLLADAGPAAASALGMAQPERHESSSAFAQIEGVYRLITRLAALRPLLVAVDDLQWCDRPSLDFLCFLGHRANRLPVTIVAAWRRGEPGVRAGRLQALAGKP
jgi:predicted ATPase